VHPGRKKRKSDISQSVDTISISLPVAVQSTISTGSMPSDLITQDMETGEAVKMATVDATVKVSLNNHHRHQPKQ
jgi:hypothetical protein